MNPARAPSQHQKFEGFLQVYVEAGGYQPALKSGGVLIAFIEQFLPVKSLEVEPYWKIKEYFGITLKFEGNHLESCFDQLLNHLATGWQPIQWEANSCWAVWNPSETATFADPAVRWANLELWHASQQT